MYAEIQNISIYKWDEYFITFPPSDLWVILKWV